MCAPVDILMLTTYNVIQFFDSLKLTLGKNGRNAPTFMPWEWDLFGKPVDKRAVEVISSKYFRI